VRFFRDIYGEDQALEKELARSRSRPHEESSIYP
jgi:hypothetical protein